MLNFCICIQLVLLFSLLIPKAGISQSNENVQLAFLAMPTEPELIELTNELEVPTSGGHLQGIQLDGNDIYISGSSSTVAYLLKADLKSGASTALLPLMEKPYKHAGGFQIAGDYLAVGIEDNDAKTSSKVCLYNLNTNHLQAQTPDLIITRKGEAKAQTAGAVGLLETGNGQYLMVVANWDSRNWDFYELDMNAVKYMQAFSFEAPADWGSYQNINLLKDTNGIYAIGTYKQGGTSKADLILVSRGNDLEPVMQLIASKNFTTKGGVNFNAAAGVYVNAAGELQLLGTGQGAGKVINLNRFGK